jgi:hypothetical protein
VADRIELKARLDFWRTALEKKRKAYLALIDGGVKSYTIDNDRSLTRFDIDKLSSEITEAERRVDELEAMLRGGKPRKAFGIVPRNF